MTDKILENIEAIPNIPLPNTPLIVEARLRVRYAETDGQGIVHHSNYPVWFELARTEYLDVIGYPYTVIEKEGYGFIITDLAIKYLSPARYDDRILVRTWCEKVGRATSFFGYQVYNETTEKLCAEGMTRLATVTPQGKLVRFNSDLYATMLTIVGRGPSKYGRLDTKD